MKNKTISVFLAVVLMISGGFTGVSSILAADFYHNPVYNWPDTGGFLGFGVFDEDWESFHLGIDIMQPAGSNVYAVADGIVVMGGNNIGGYGIDGGSGGAVVIEHSNPDGESFFALYGHLFVSVDVGQEVAKGEVIGNIMKLGAIPHLHFGINVVHPSYSGYGTLTGGGFVNPAEYLGGIGSAEDSDNTKISKEIDNIEEPDNIDNPETPEIPDSPEKIDKTHDSYGIDKDTDIEDIEDIEDIPDLESIENTPILAGYVNRDGEITIQDALEILKYLAGIPSVYDVGDAHPGFPQSAPTMQDALEILKHLAGLDSLINAQTDSEQTEKTEKPEQIEQIEQIEQTDENQPEQKPDKT